MKHIICKWVTVHDFLTFVSAWSDHMHNRRQQFAFVFYGVFTFADKIRWVCFYALMRGKQHKEQSESKVLVDIENSV